MQNEIIQKLRGVLSVPVKRESEVVYLFVEIRKFLDRAKGKQSFPVLRMFCNWVVHTSLEKYGKGSVLASLDNALAVAESKGHFDQAFRKASDIFSLQLLNEELKNFLQNNSLPTNLADDPAKWGQLVKLYVNVVSECPLVFKMENYPFKSLKSGRLEACEIPPTFSDADHFNVAWRWKLEPRTGTTRTRSCTFGYSKIGHYRDRVIIDV